MLGLRCWPRQGCPEMLATVYGRFASANKKDVCKAIVAHPDGEI